MLLTITYSQFPATDLGYLLYKNPSRPQTFELNYGKAHVFYPEATDESCTVALLLDIDPIDLARGKKGSNGGGLFDYVNDRPYVSSSFLSVALGRVFGTAMTGKCKDKPELAQKPLPFVVKIVMLPAKGEESIINRLFEPLGYKVTIEGFMLDDKFPEWGKSRYCNVTLEGTVILKDLLNHLYVLIPVLDTQKHYYVGEDEIEKLLLHGDGWLSEHPEKGFITGRYLKKKKSLINRALERLAEDETEDDADENDDKEPLEVREKRIGLNRQRLEAVVAALKNSNAKRVIDIGCGEGNLLTLLLKDNYFEEIAGVDVCYNVLERAKDKLKVERLPDFKKDRIKLFQGSLIYRDSRFNGYDAAAVVEVIEHMDLNRLKAFEKVLFQFARPNTVVLSTPNVEYNIKYSNMPKDVLRHKDHRFEWTRNEFKDWATKIGSQYNYEVRFLDIGDMDEELGSPTQMGIFTLRTEGEKR